MSVLEIATNRMYTGLSTDSKPTGVPPGTLFFETNTGLLYITYDTGANWTIYSAGHDYPLVRKTVDFTGASGLGLVNVAVPWFNVTGAVHIERLEGYVNDTLISAGGSLSLGVTGGGTSIAAALAADGTAGNFVTGEHWGAAAPAATVTQLAQAFREMAVSAAQIISNVTTASITDGTMTLTAKWHPISANGLLAPA